MCFLFDNQEQEHYDTSPTAFENAVVLYHCVISFWIIMHIVITTDLVQRANTQVCLHIEVE